MMLQTYLTSNTSSEIVVSLSSVSHVIEHKNNDESQQLESCWIHFHSGKSVHVNSSFDEVLEDLESFYNSKE